MNDDIVTPNAAAREGERMKSAGTSDPKDVFLVRVECSDANFHVLGHTRAEAMERAGHFRELVESGAGWDEIKAFLATLPAEDCWFEPKPGDEDLWFGPKPQ